MNKLVFFYFLITYNIVNAGGFVFPNVPYEYGRVYLFNTTEGAETNRPEFSIYYNGVYAKSKVGEGWKFTKDMNSDLIIQVLRYGTDMMQNGLSGCYIPRHGIIYFDQIGNPVASLSICFECQRIHFWSTEPLPEPSTSSSEKKIIQTEKQFADLEALFTKFGIPVFKNTPEYAVHIQKNDSLYSSNGEIIFDYTNAEIGFTKVSVSEFQKWIIKEGFRLRESKETAFAHREGDTTSWTYPVLSDNQGTKISFNELYSIGEDTPKSPVLTEASIVNPEIKLPNGISVGMSLSQVQSIFQVWDGIAYPASIVVNYKNANVRYLFEKRTLVRIELVMI
ncbi:MAG: hypothetical protein IPM77_11645 [Crocinitomicaceae bacterium]|nr:hypothetical protein [Crocinitomicaceae bacterium]